MIVMFFILFDLHTAPIVNCTKVDKFFNFGESFRIARGWDENAKKRGGLGIFLIGREESGKWKIPKVLTKVTAYFSTLVLTFRLLALTCEH